MTESQEHSEQDDEQTGRVDRGEAYRTFQAKYYNDPEGFVIDCFIWKSGKGPTKYQKKILRRVIEKKRVSARGPRGLGKTALSSWLILWFALTRDGKDWKIPTTAGSWGQLTKYLWPEVRKWARKIRWDVVGREQFNSRTELLMHSLKLDTGEAFAISPDQPDLIEGAHADCLFFVFDESKVVSPATFDSVEGAFSNASEESDNEAFATAFSTPGEPNGRFYDIQTRKPGYEDWDVVVVTLQETIDAGIITQEWADRRKRQWGENDQRYQNHVLGNFASSDENGVVPLYWIEQAIERWYVWAGGILDRLGIKWADYTELVRKFETVPPTEKGVLKKLGADIAGGGADKTVLAPLYEWEGGQAIDYLRYSSTRDTMETAGKIAGILDSAAGASAIAIIDVIGLGSGPYNRLKEQGKNVEGFTAGERSENRDSTDEHGFINKRSAGWWGLRERLDPDLDADLALPPDDLLIGDLTAPHWKEVSGGKLQVESKPDIKTRIGRSTDSGDAVMMAVFVEQKKVNKWATIAREHNKAKAAQAEQSEEVA